MKIEIELNHSTYRFIEQVALERKMTTKEVIQELCNGLREAASKGFKKIVTRVINNGQVDEVSRTLDKIHKDCIQNDN